jgi:hypothetical protein
MANMERGFATNLVVLAILKEFGYETDTWETVIRMFFASETGKFEK